MAEYPRLLMLDPGDNIAVATADLAAGRSSSSMASC